MARKRLSIEAAAGKKLGRFVGQTVKAGGSATRRAAEDAAVSAAQSSAKAQRVARITKAAEQTPAKQAPAGPTPVSPTVESLRRMVQEPLGLGALRDALAPPKKKKKGQ
jgi:hypothetical protein